jgi:hypothetical protein
MGTSEYCTHIEETPVAYIAGILYAYLRPVLHLHHSMNTVYLLIVSETKSVNKYSSLLNWYIFTIMSWVVDDCNDCLYLSYLPTT